MRDNEGFVVVSKLNEEMAGNIAKAGKGAYVRVDNTNNAQTIIENELDKLQKDDVKTEVKFRHLCLYSRAYMKHHEHGQRHESQYHYRKMKYLHYLVSHTICVLF